MSHRSDIGHVSEAGLEIPIKWSAAKKCYGYMDQRTGEVRICRKAEDREVFREVLLHEVLHRMFPWMDEPTVAAAACVLNESLDVCEDYC